MSKSKISFRRHLLRAGIATATTTAVVASVCTPVYAAAVTLTLSASSAPVSSVAAGLNISASSTTSWIPSSGTPKVLLNTATCATGYPSSVPSTATDSGNLTRITGYKGYFTVATSLAPSATTKYNVCAYLGSTANDALIGSSTFTISPSPSISSLDVTSGPSAGGTTVTVTGTGFPTTAAGFGAATLGSSSITTITPGTATSFTFVTPPNTTTGSALLLTVNTSTAGAMTKSSAFTYYNGISVTPNSAVYVSTTAPDTQIDITGAGFTMFSGSVAAWLPDTAHPHVFLTQGAYSPAATAHVYTTAPITECQPATVIFVSDNEIICTLKLTKTLTTAGPPSTQVGWTNAAAVAPGAYTVSVVADATAVTGTTTGASEVTASSTFTVATY